MYKQNLHTHSCFCDGSDTLESMITAAIEKGFDSIGFSGHSYTPFDLRYCMSPEKTAQYVTECRRLREKYKDVIDVYCGIEQDFYAPSPMYEHDYVIGSVHYIRVGKEYISVDVSADILSDAANKHFGGDMYALVEAYYDTVAEVAEKTRCDVVGHFDVITKFIERSPLFDIDDARYAAAANRALDRLLCTDVIFEINSGAVAGGYRTLPYPSEKLLLRIASRGGKITFSADCHDKNKLDLYRDEMQKLAVATGFDTYYVLRGGKFVPVPLT